MTISHTSFSCPVCHEQWVLKHDGSARVWHEEQFWNLPIYINCFWYFMWEHHVRECKAKALMPDKSFAHQVEKWLNGGETV